jgi:hypothetical protein
VPCRRRDYERVNNFIKVTTSDIREIVVAVPDMACFGGSTLNYNIRLNQEGAGFLVEVTLDHLPTWHVSCICIAYLQC